MFSVFFFVRVEFCYISQVGPLCFLHFTFSYSPAIVCIAQVTKGNEGVNLEKLAIVSTYESVLKLLLLDRLEGFLD